MEKVNCVLLVDDDEISNYLSERVIKKLEFSNKVKKSTNGEEALLYLAKHCCTFDDIYFPELILLDNNMPEMTGIEFLESLKSMNISTNDRMKVVVLTATANPKEEARLKELGISGFLTKPLTEEKLLEVVAAI